MAQKQLHGLKVAILATDGVEQVELLKPRQALKDAGAETKVVSPKSGKIKGWNHTEWGEQIPVDIELNNAKPDDFDALLLPGGVHESRQAAHGAEGGAVREILLPEGQAGSGDLSRALDDHRGRRSKRTSHRFLAIGENRLEECRRGVGG